MSNDCMIDDLRNSVRSLARNPAFAALALTAAALGIGASTAVFSVVDGVLFRPLPYAHEARLVSAGMMTPLDSNEFLFAEPYFDLRRNRGPLEAVTAFEAGAFPCDLTERDPLRLRCMRVEANFFETLGVRLPLGRTFSAEEDSRSGLRVALITHALWRSRFAGDPRAIGAKLIVDGAETAIVGVLPRDFEMPMLNRVDLLLPLALDESRERSGRAFRVFGRMKPGLTAEQAQQRLGPFFARALETVPPRFRKEIALRVRSLRDRQVGDSREASIALFGAVLAVLLIACANVANLLLARAAARDREHAVRAALGATRARLARQALADSALLGGLGGVAGCGIAFALLRWFAALAPSGLPRLERASLDWRAVAFAAAASLISAAIFGVAPALHRPSTALLGGGQRTTRAAGGVRAILVTAQIAVTVVLLTGAGLLLRSLWKLESVPLGMETDRVVTARFTLGRQRYQHDAQQLSFFEELERRAAAMPGAAAAAIADSLPPSGGTRARALSVIEVEGREPMPEGTGGMVAWRYVTPGYFAALGVPILRGRGFTPEDRRPDTHSVVVSEALARRLFPGEDPLGRRMIRGPKGEWFTVVGVAGDVRNSGAAKDAGPEYYLVRKPARDFVYAQQEPPIGWRAATLLVRTPLDPRLLAGELRDLFASIDPALPVEVETMRQRLDGLNARPRLNATLLGGFAAAGLALASIGLFGVLSFLVSRRTREIGVRIALGATARSVLGLILRDAARWTVAGIALGLAGSLALTRALRTMLFQVEPTDPFAFAAAIVVLLAVAAAAATGPALRAARLDPIATLRQD